MNGERGMNVKLKRGDEREIKGEGAVMREEDLAGFLEQF